MRDFRSLPHYRPDAPGARLDDQEWASSWPAFFAAVFNDRDASARQFIANAWTERTGAGGGFLVPEQLRASVMAYVTPPVVRPRAMVLPMDSLRLHLPVLDNPSQQNGSQALGGLTFSVTENGAQIAASAPQFGQAVLEARKLAALVPVPNELVSDGAGALHDFISRVVSIGYHWAEDDLFIAGTGANGPEGVLNADCAVRVPRVTGETAPLLADIMALAKALHPASKAAGYTAGVDSVGWLISASVFDSLLELFFLPAGATPSSGVPTSPSNWLELGDGHQVGPSMLGLPAWVTDHQPVAGSPGDLAIADLRHYAIGDRMELTVEPSGRGSGFITDVTNYRFKARVDGRYLLQGPVTPESGPGTNNVNVISPVAVLQ